MKQILTISICFLFLSSCATTKDWSRDDRYLYHYFTALNVIDCLQTKYIYKSPTHKEAWPPAIIIVDDKPERIIPMFIATNLLVLKTAGMLSPKWRKRLLGTATLFEVYAVGRNYCFGVGLEF